MDANHAARREEEVRRINDRMARMGPGYSLGSDPYFPHMYPIIYAEVQARLANPQPAPEYDSEDPDEPEYNLENPVVPENNEQDLVVPEINEEDPADPFYDLDGPEEEDDDDESDGSRQGFVSDESDGFLSNDELNEDFFPMAPVNAPINWDDENAWNAMHPEPLVPLPPPPPVEVVEPEPDSDVDDGPPPPPPPQEVVYCEGPGWIPWFGHHADYEPNTLVYINVPNMYSCPWKQIGGPFYLGPVTLLTACREGYYDVAVPHGFRRHVTWRFRFHRVSHRRPEAKHRIIPLNSNFDDRQFYDEVAIDADVPRWDDNMNPRGLYWRTTWRCMGVEEVTLESDSNLRRNFPNVFNQHD